MASGCRTRKKRSFYRDTTLYFCLSLLLATTPPRVPFRCYAYPPGAYPFAARALTCDPLSGVRAPRVTDG